MKQETWARIEALFAELVAHPPEARPDLLEKLAGGDEELRREVESLLACDRPGRGLEQTVRVAAAAMFDAEAAAGERVGSYRLIRKVGQGGMGTVYLAVRADDHYQQQVAIKLLPAYPVVSGSYQMLW